MNLLGGNKYKIYNTTTRLCLSCTPSAICTPRWCEDQFARSTECNLTCICYYSQTSLFVVLLSWTRGIVLVARIRRPVQRIYKTMRFVEDIRSTPREVDKLHFPDENLRYKIDTRCRNREDRAEDRDGSPLSGLKFEFKLNLRHLHRSRMS